MFGAWVGAAWGQDTCEIIRDFVLSALATIATKKTRRRNKFASEIVVVHNNRAFQMNAIDILWGFFHRNFQTLGANNDRSIPNR